MKKTLVIVIAVAILGGAGIYTKSHKNPMDETAVAGANTSAQAAKTADATASTAAPASADSSSSSSSTASGYKDGTYTGAAEDTAYGTVQVAVVVSGGSITDVKFLKMPDSAGHTQEVTNESEGPLRQSAIAKQSAHIDFVSGATQTSEGYQLSLQSALNQAS